MKKNLEKYSKEELIKLREDIDKRLKFVEIKSTIIKENTLLSLKKGDKIFGIRLSFGGHTLVEPNELNGKVDIIDYCIIKDNDKRDDSFRICISHPEQPFGITTTLENDEYGDDWCLLVMNENKSGYDGFYTLKPNIWEDDLKRLFNKKLEYKKFSYEKSLKLYQDKLNLFFEAKEYINKLIL